MDFQNRQYDPQIGRFLSVDPLADDGQEEWSPYAGMGNNPAMMVDPLGLKNYMHDFHSNTTASPVYGGAGRREYNPGRNADEFREMNAALAMGAHDLKIRSQFYEISGMFPEVGVGVSANNNLTKEGNGNLGKGDDLIPQGSKIVDVTETTITYSTESGYLMVENDKNIIKFAEDHVDNFEGFSGKVEWVFSGGRVGYGRYDWNGDLERTDFSIGGTAPVPSFSGIKVAGTVNAVSKLWSATKKLSAAENALAHFVKHGKEFDEFYNATQYVKGAKEFLTNSPTGTLMKIRANGDILKYHPPTNTFGVMNAAGAPKTMFRPTDGMAYWLAQ